MGYRGPGLGVASHHHSPHKFRHGHAVYALKMAKYVSTLKAVSQNLMHADLSITDGVTVFCLKPTLGSRSPRLVMVWRIVKMRRS